MSRITQCRRSRTIPFWGPLDTVLLLCYSISPSVLRRDDYARVVALFGRIRATDCDAPVVICDAKSFALMFCSSKFRRDEGLPNVELGFFSLSKNNRSDLNVRTAKA